MNNVKKVRLACYASNVTAAIVGNLSSLLFLTFRFLYGISFSLLGTLVLINFCTQLLIDLIFSFFSHKLNIPICIKLAPILAIIGLIVFAAAPFLFAGSIYLGLAIGTVIFSAASGLNESLISPVIAALPSDNPDRDMSKAHSIYAWGVIAVVVVVTLFLLCFGNAYWYFLPLIFTVVPLYSCLLFFSSTLPDLGTPEKSSGVLSLLKNKQLLLCVVAIFFGSACELIMTQWCSSYLEQALGLEKVWGDIFGVATFALMLGLGRTLYAKFGKNIEKVLFLSAVGSLLCYAICILSPLPIIGLVACALTGFCVAMLWPGCLVVGAKRITTGGVFIYATLAAGGDLGAAVGPQLTGVVTDLVAASPSLCAWGQTLGFTVEELSMKAGMCVGVFFSILALFTFLYIWKSKKQTDKPKPLYE